MRRWEFAETFIEVVSQCRQPLCETQVSYTDFVRLGLLSLGFYRDSRDADKLIDHYVQLGLIPTRNFMQDAHIAGAVAEAKALFV